MLRRNPTRLDTSPDEADLRATLVAARKAREVELGITKPEDALSGDADPPKLTTAQRVGYAKKPSSETS